ncbi:hypothetical protein PSHT_03039 [Puccinia striiformis]|uniref:Uncharacterized protein n=1 Tax=Puccinia striiformis TaxID=27350 RepID=A0A2S4WGC7_9BASI|nr:hypothetical protein PSHT_03039 [Puccinia striiformis]
MFGVPPKKQQLTLNIHTNGNVKQQRGSNSLVCTAGTTSKDWFIWPPLACLSGLCGSYFELHGQFGTRAISHIYCSPKDCFVTLDPTSITFEFVSVKPMITWTKSYKRILLQGPPRCDDNEAALFCKPAAMPTEHDQMFKQWIWGINITQQGRPNVSIMQEMLDAAHEERRAVVILLERLKIHSG